MCFFSFVSILKENTKYLKYLIYLKYLNKNINKMLFSTKLNQSIKI